MSERFESSTLARTGRVAAVEKTERAGIPGTTGGTGCRFYKPNPEHQECLLRSPDCRTRQTAIRLHPADKSGPMCLIRTAAGPESRLDIRSTRHNIPLPFSSCHEVPT